MQSIPHKTPKRKTEGGRPSKQFPEPRLLPFSENARKFYPTLTYAETRTDAVVGVASFLQENIYQRHRREASQADVMIDVAHQLIHEAVQSATTPGEREGFQKALGHLIDAGNALGDAMFHWTRVECSRPDGESAVREFVETMSDMENQRA